MKSSSLEQEFVSKLNTSQGIVHKVCSMYCDNEEDRKDLFQEILIHLWKSYPSFKGDSQFSTWMYRVSLNIALQDLRKVKKNKEDSVLPSSFDSVESDSIDESPTIEQKLLWQAISKLNDIEKAIMMLYLEDKLNEEIAEILGITQNYVRVKMTRIRQKLKNMVED